MRWRARSVLLNVGDGPRPTPAAAGREDPAVAAAVRSFVWNGGGFVGVGEPSGPPAYEGHYLQLARPAYWAWKKETGFTLGYDKYNWERSTPATSSWRTARSRCGFRRGTKGIYALAGTEILVQREKEVQMAVHSFGAGRCGVSSAACRTALKTAASCTAASSWSRPRRGSACTGGSAATVNVEGPRSA
ncbi:MAG: lacto-N-biose phosphorylase central domain-containing protein [Intestinimonas sp.]